MNLFTNQSNHQTDIENAVCRMTREQLSAYVDNTLSARQVWDVEKHLAACPECAEASRQMQATVQLLHIAEKHDTSDDFMAKLHARLDVLEPEPARRQSLAKRMRDWSLELRAGLALRQTPQLRLGIAAAGVAALVLLTRLPAPIANPTQSKGPAMTTAAPTNGVGVHENLQRNVALTANDPFGDVAAEYLESAEGSREAGGKEANGS